MVRQSHSGDAARSRRHKAISMPNERFSLMERPAPGAEGAADRTRVTARCHGQLYPPAQGSIRGVVAARSSRAKRRGTCDNRRDHRKEAPVTRFSSANPPTWSKCACEGLDGLIPTAARRIGLGEKGAVKAPAHPPARRISPFLTAM